MGGLRTLLENVDRTGQAGKAILPIWQAKTGLRVYRILYLG